MKAIRFFEIIATLVVAMLVVSCSSQPYAATPELPATPTELNVHLPVPTDYVKRGFTVVPTVILTPEPPPTFETPVVNVYRDYAKYYKTTLPLGKCEYCPPATQDVSDAKLNVGEFAVRIEDIQVFKIASRLTVEIPDGQKNAVLKTVWHASPFVNGRQLFSSSGGRDYGNSSYEKNEYELPESAEQIEIQIITGEVSPVRFSLWFQFVK